MPLIRRDAPASSAQSAEQPAFETRLADLRDADAERRWAAARALSGSPDAVPALAEALAAETDERVREALLTALLRIGGPPAVAALLPLLRSDDAALRAGALDALQAMPEAVLPHMPDLLGDTDVDVRVLAADLARSLPPAEANALLADLLDNEFDPNVCAAAIDVLAEIGTAEAVPALERCAARFGSEAFLPFAVRVALERISGSLGAA